MNRPGIIDLIINDRKIRDRIQSEEYGVPLSPENPYEQPYPYEKPQNSEDKSPTTIIIDMCNE